MAAFEVRDVNAEIAGALRDMALVHASPHGRIAYRRAARAVMALEEPLASLLQRHDARAIRFIGPASERVIREHLELGASPTVEAAVERSPRSAEVLASRADRATFLSRAAARVILGAPAHDVIGIADYRGD